jgi:hypothetical protein
MPRRLRHRYWLELFLAVVSGVLLVLTLILPEWIEVIFGADPDRGSGEFEWLIAAAPLVVLIISSVLALREWRRAAVTG